MSSQSLSSALFQSATRSAVLELLFIDGLAASVSELARRSGLSPRTVGNEVRHLAKTGLVHVDTIGTADVVRANTDHPAADHLRGLLRAPMEPPRDAKEARQVRESLAAWGAPLAGVRPRKNHPLTETLLKGLEEARSDGTVLRVLPVLVARHRRELDWAEIREEARRRKLKSELGFLIEMSAGLLGDPAMGSETTSLIDRRRRSMRFFPLVKNSYEEELARRRSPELARRWGFWMNVSQDSFRSLLDKHGA
jgi:hypothetical protein